MKKSINKKVKKRIIISVLILVFLLALCFLIIPFIAIDIVFKTHIDKKYKVQKFLKVNVNDYDNLTRQDYSYTSDKKQHIQSYLYTQKAPTTYKGLIIFSHGFLIGGHSYYMPGIKYLIENNFMVISFDASGNGESDDISMQGFQQGVIDLERLIKKVKSDSKLSRYPLFLIGHSWGGYNVSAVLNLCPDVAGTVVVSGFNSINDIMKEIVNKYNADYNTILNTLFPYIDAYNELRFNKYSNLSASDGLSKTTGNVMIISSEKDLTVPSTAGYNIYYNKFKTDPRFKFKMYQKKHHEYFDFTPESATKINDFLASYHTAFLDKNFNVEGDEEDIENLINNLFDYEVFINHLDTNFLDDILDFINNTIVGRKVG